MSAATLHRFSLELLQPLRTAKGEVTHRTGILLCLAAENGERGWGEAAPLPGWPGPGLAATEQSLRDWIAGGPKPSAGTARAAIDGAQIDLAARRSGQSLATYLRGDAADSVVVNALLDSPDPEMLAMDAAQAVAQGFTTLKIKVGAGTQDLDRIAQARVAAPEALLRLDANQAWALDEATTFCRAVERFDIEFIEEPVTGGMAALAAIRPKIGIAVAADESLASLDIDEFAALPVDVLVLKPSTLGRHEALLDLAKQRRVVVTSFVDSAVGVATALHLAAAMPGPVVASGLAISGRFEKDVAELPAVSDGRLAVPAGPGIGVSPQLEEEVVS